MMDKPTFRKRNLSINPVIAKYRLRKPRMAKAFEVKTINGSCVMESTAGMESKAKTISVDSNIVRTIKSGVIKNLPLCFTKNFPFTKSEVTGNIFFSILTKGFFSIFPSSLLGKSILMPDMIRKIPNT